MDEKGVLRIDRTRVLYDSLREGVLKDIDIGVNREGVLIYIDIGSRRCSERYIDLGVLIEKVVIRHICSAFPHLVQFISIQLSTLVHIQLFEFYRCSSS